MFWPLTAATLPPPPPLLLQAASETQSAAVPSAATVRSVRDIGSPSEGWDVKERRPLCLRRPAPGSGRASPILRAFRAASVLRELAANRRSLLQLLGQVVRVGRERHLLGF